MKKNSTDLSLYVGVGILSLGALLFEVSLIRIFSVSQWYHFAFMVVSIALLGFGASGSILAILPSRWRALDFSSLRITAFLFSISTILCYIVVNRIHFDPVKLAWDTYQLFRLLGYYVFLAIPFFFAGLTFAIAFTIRCEVVGKIYFTDLLGAGLGGVSALIVFASFGASGAVILASLLGGIAALCFSFTIRDKLKIIFLALICALILLLWIRPNFLAVRISPYKGLMLALRYPESQLLQTQWNSFSRVDIVKSPLVRFAPGLSLSYLKPLPPQIGVTVDGDNLNAITKYSGNREKLEFTAYLPSSLPFYVGQRNRVLVVEPMGGLDVLSALYHSCNNIKAVELNPLIIDLISRDYKEFSGKLYSSGKVDISVGEPRAWLRGSDEKFDIITYSPTDVLGAASSGIYGLNENYIFTRESIITFYQHLEEDGLFCLNVYLLPPPRQELRLVSVIMDALESLKIEEPEKHISVIRSWGTFTILLKKNPFTQNDIDKIKDFCHRRQFDVVYYNGIGSEEVNQYNQFPRPIYFDAISKIVDKNQRNQFYDDYLYNITPVGDDKPFFYHFFRLKKLPEVYRSIGHKWQPFIQADYLIFIIFVQALIASIVFIVLPVIFRKKSNEKDKRSSKGKRSLLLLYFLFIGLGFMLVEISLIQKFILVLMHPVYSMATVLVGILIFSGIGSIVSERLYFSLSKIIIYLTLIVLGYSIFMPYMLDFIISQISTVRFCLTLSLLLPLGFFMGMCFPQGIRIVSRYDKGLIPWAWCVNGCASVLSSVMAIMIALIIGFRLVLGIAGLSYIFAALCILLSGLKTGSYEEISIT